LGYGDPSDRTQAVPSATRFSSRMDIAHRPLEATAGKALPPRDKWATPLGIGIH